MSLCALLRVAARLPEFFWQALGLHVLLRVSKPAAVAPPAALMPLRLLIAAALVAAAFLPRPSVRAQPAPADTARLRLGALLRDAREANPRLRAARLRAEALAREPEQAGALPDPTAGLTYQPRPILTARGYQRSQLQVGQRIPFPGKRRLRSEIAALEAEVAGAEAGILGQDLAFEVSASYYELYRAQEQTRLVRAFQRQLDSFEEAATTRYEVGEGSQQAILKAQIERERLALRLETLAAERRSALEALARLTDQPGLDAPEAPAEIAPPAVPPGEDGLAAALEARPEARALRRSEEQAERRIALACKAFWPDFTVGARYFDLGAADLSPAMTGRDALALSVGVKVPLWRGKQRARLEQAQVRRRQAEARLDALRLEVQTDLADLQSRLRRQERQLQLLAEALIPQAETALEATLSAYSAGRTDFLDLLDAERTLFQLQMERETTYARHLTTRARLLRALGRAPRPTDRQ